MADEVADESPAQRQARLRREKRNAKIQAEGSDRLAKIGQLQGRIIPAAAPPPGTGQYVRQLSMYPLTHFVAPPGPTVDADDPAEVDISEHHWTPTSRSQQQNASQMQGQPNLFGYDASGTDGSSDTAGDPMMRMMQQMLGAGGMGGGGPGGDPMAGMDDLPPFLKAMMNGQQQTQQEEAQAGPKTNSAYLWRIVHAVFALSLAFYIALTTTFNGSALSRSFDGRGQMSVQGPKLFYVFATAELVLQTSRYYVEKGHLTGTGWLATIANSGFVPEPWAGYLRVVGRYAVIWRTIVGDAMTIVFVLGILAWWRGVAIA